MPAVIDAARPHALRASLLHGAAPGRYLARVFSPRSLNVSRGTVVFGAALVLSACGDDRRAPGAPIASTMRGPDAVLLRVPRGGGRVTAAVSPRLDSVVWRSRESAPALARVLAFDAEGGQLAAVDTAGLPVRLDLRLGTTRRASRTPLGALAAAGTTFYGLAADGAVTRLTPTGGAWTVRLTPAPQALYPQRDGSVLAAGTRGGTGVVWVLHPPTAGPTDSVRVPGGARAVRLGAADRVYFAGGDELLAVQARTLAPAAPIALGAAFRAAAASPSGDRLYVLTDRAAEVRVVDRYAGTVSATVPLPGAARDLRVDPLGRYLLVRPERGDSAWVMAVGTGRVLGAVPGAWREDLPLVLPDGSILATAGRDVAVVDGETLRTRRTVAGGAGDFWHLVLWNGFRPRAAGLDQPVTFSEVEGNDVAADDTLAADSLGTPGDTAAPATAPPRAAPAETTTVPRPTVPRPTVPRPTVLPPSASVHPEMVVDEAAGEVVAVAYTGGLPSTPTADQPASAPTTAAARGRRRGARRSYTVQFAAAPSEREARRALGRLRVPGATLRVVPRVFDGQTVYRVVAGPYGTRADAERAGRTAGVGNYWVYEGAP